MATTETPQAARAPVARKIPPGDGSASAFQLGGARLIDSTELLGGATCIAICHGGERYWLRATRQGKLLLTK